MQTSLFPMKSELKFGGELLKGKRKGRRPLCTKRPIHLVLRAKQHRLKANEATVRLEIARAGKRWGIRIYQWAIVSDHIHLLIRVSTRSAYKFFVQRVSGVVALRLGINWLFRPFTRIVAWGLGFKRAKNYIEMNFFESEGFIPHQVRGKGATRVRPWYSNATI